ASGYHAWRSGEGYWCRRASARNNSHAKTSTVRIPTTTITLRRFPLLDAQRVSVGPAGDVCNRVKRHTRTVRGTARGCAMYMGRSAVQEDVLRKLRKLTMRMLPIITAAVCALASACSSTHSPNATEAQFSA